MRDGSPRRRAAFSVSSGVSTIDRALCHGLSGPGGSATVSTSTTVLFGSVHRHVEPDIEHVLVDVADDAGRDRVPRPDLAVLHQARRC